MNLKILISMAVVGLAASATVYGTFAFFSDTETSTNNIFTAGTLDLTLNGLNGVTATITGTNFAPGDTTSGSILLRNEGSIFTGDAQGHTVDLDFKVVLTSTDNVGLAGDPDLAAPSLTGFERYLEVTTLTYGTTNLLPLGDVDGDGWSNTLADLELRGTFADLADPLAAGKTLSIAVQLRTDTPNHIKKDQVNLGFTFFLSQSIGPDLGKTVVARNVGNPTIAFPGQTWNTASTTLSPGGERYIGNLTSQNVTLTLTGLPAHTILTVEYDFYALSSWDGNGPAGPDRLRMGVDGVRTVDTTFGMFGGTTQCWPSNCPASFPARTGAHGNNLVGATWSGSPMDSVYRISRTVSHTGGTATIFWHGMPSEGITNEYWGLDNVRVLVS